MIIQYSISAINSYRNLDINQGTLSKSLEKLSPGYKIDHVDDGAAGLAISGSMRSQINDLDQASASAKDAIGLIKTVEDMLSEIHSMPQRITALAERATNGTHNTVTRGNIREEYKALTREIKRTSENADSNGTKPLTMDKEVTMTFWIGPTSDETIAIGKEDTYDKTVTAAMSLKLSVQSDTKSTLETIETTIGNVSACRAEPDTIQNHLEHTAKSLGIASENVAGAESRIRDTDMADEITAFTKNNILLQAAQPVLIQSNTAPQGILSLSQ